MTTTTDVDVKSLSYEDVIELYATHGGERAAARFLGVARTTLQDHFYKLKAERFKHTEGKKAVEIAATSNGVRAFILSSAQDSTRIHRGFLRNLEAYAAHTKAEIMISGFTYNKTLFEDHSKHHTFYPVEIEAYLTQERINIGPRLAFCGEMNTLPTAVNPLSGFETYTRDRWGIFPHPKVHLKSIPTAKGDPAKIIMTTGTVSLPNYVQKKAGIKAEFNHEIGAVFVELMPDGSFFARHLLADEDGAFYDLTKHVKNGKVTEEWGSNIEAVTWGDIHFEKGDPTIFRSIWGEAAWPIANETLEFTPMLDYLAPSHQFVHDVIDFTPRNHHNIKDPHFRFKMHVKGTDSVHETFQATAEFLTAVTRPWVETVVVESNHDLALLKWLKTADYREDPENALYFLKLQTATYQAIHDGDEEFQILPWALRQEADLDNIRFLSEDDSYTIAGGIECGFHGHNGANGSPGSAMQFSKMGKRSNTAHTHSATIENGSYVAGVSGRLDMGYNKGLSSWSHSHIATYVNGKRTILTQRPDGLYCADVSGLDYVSG